MEITEVRVFPREGRDRKLKAYVTVTFDKVFVVRDIKIIEGKGQMFLAMPSRKRRFSCLECGFGNEVGSRFCNKCGVTLPFMGEEEVADPQGARSNYRDITHPVTRGFREHLQSVILEVYRKEVASGRTSYPGRTDMDE